MRTIDFDHVRVLALNHFGDKAGPFMEDVYRMSSSEKHLNLAELTEEVAKLPGTLVMRVDCSQGFVNYLDSYRGYYDQLSIGCDDHECHGKTAVEFLAMLRSADGKTFEGYKGGEYRMHAATPMWVSEYGEASERAVTGVKVDGNYAVITTMLDD